MLGSSDQIETLLRERLERARSDWCQQRYNPDLIPELERDPFETAEEFAAHLAERPWYVGKGELRKAEYDIETGRFPLAIQVLRNWATHWLDATTFFILRLPRDLARALYQRGATWPLYAHLAVEGSQVSLASLVLVGAEGELAVEIRSPEMASEARRVAPGSLNSGRYRDLGDGTLVDTRTGLQWMRCALGQRWDGEVWIGDGNKYPWEGLATLSDNFNMNGGYCGYTDWRIPTIDELKTIIKVFPGEYWSSTTDSSSTTGYSNNAWSIDLGDGYVSRSNKKNTYYIRLVRG